MHFLLVADRNKEKRILVLAPSQPSKDLLGRFVVELNPFH